MTFTPGNKIATGRPKGSTNKRLKAIEEMAHELNCNPVEILLRFAKGDWAGLGYSKGTKSVYTEAGIIEEDLISPGERIQAAKDVAGYLYAKKKSIEYVKPNMLDDMTPEQKLDAMKQAVQLLEREVNGDILGQSRDK